MTNNPITGTTCRSRLRAKPEEASFHLGPVSLVPAANIHKACGRHKDFQSQSKVQVLDGRASDLQLNTITDMEAAHYALVRPNGRAS